MRAIVGARHTTSRSGSELRFAEKDAVSRAQVAEKDLPAAARDDGVLARRVGIGERQVARLGASDHVRAPFLGEQDLLADVGTLGHAYLRDRVVADRVHRALHQREGEIARREPEVGRGRLLPDDELEPHAADAHEIAGFHARAATAG